MRNRLKKSNYIFLAMLSASLLVLLLGAIFKCIPIIAIGLLIAFGSFIFRVIVYRCPYCGYYLGKLSGTYCPHCKKEIE